MKVKINVVRKRIDYNNTSSHQEKPELHLFGAVDMYQNACTPLFLGMKCSEASVVIPFI